MSRRILGYLVAVTTFSGIYDAFNNPSFGQLRNEAHYMEEISWKPSPKATFLNIDEVVALALKFSPQIKSQIDFVTSANYQVLSQRATWYPTISINGFSEYLQGAAQSYGPQSKYNSFTQSRYETLSPSLNINWTVFNLSRDANISASIAQLYQQKASLDGICKSVMAQAMQGFVKLQYSIAQYEASRIVSLNSLTFYKAGVSLYRAGIASMYDVTKQRAVLYQTVSNTKASINNIKTAQYQLKATIGLPIDSPEIIPKTDLNLLGVWPETLPKSIEQAIVTNDNLKQTEALARFYIQNAKSIAYNYLPTLSVSLTSNPSATYGYPTYQATLVPGYRSYGYENSVSANLSWQFMDGGVNRSQSNQQLFQAKAQKENAKNILDGIVSDTSSQFSTVKNYEFIIQNNVEQVRTSVDLLTMDVGALRIGKGSATDIAQDQNTVISATESLLNNVLLYNNNLISLKFGTMIDFAPLPPEKSINVKKILEPLKKPLLKAF